ncbi:MAG: hypothetical protein LBV22_02940 [Mycoplasmataceae bacterium]|jgi:hypothetical protein|nr:hypothetical protein [Mycoplasmataceae bacterium]
MKKNKQEKQILAINQKDLAQLKSKMDLSQYDLYDLTKLNYVLEFEKLRIQEIDYIKKLIKEKQE